LLHYLHYSAHAGKIRLLARGYHGWKAVA
jgi:hypothetical protein